MRTMAVPVDRLGLAAGDSADGSNTAPEGGQFRGRTPRRAQAVPDK